jgi:predicted ATP-grasp superfamily ATP-dependent carboligase
MGKKTGRLEAYELKDVIVLAKSYIITLGVARSLGEAGYGVKVLALNQNTGLISGKSKYVKEVCKARDNFEEIWCALEELRGHEERILVIPLEDITCRMLDEHAKQLQEHYEIPTLGIRNGGITEFMDKTTQKRAAQQCGLLVASGKAYSTDDEGIEQAVKEVLFPCFQKPLASSNSISGSKECFAKCTNREELQSAMKKARNQACGMVLLEAFLPIEKELTAYGVAKNGQVYLPACMEAFRLNKGVAAEGIVKSAKCLGETKRKLEEFVSNTGLTGLFCIDLIQSDGKLYFSEINLRGGGSGYAITLAGANLPGALADMVYNHSAEGPEDIQREVRFLNEFIELAAFRDGNVSWKEYKSHMAGQQERFVENKLDPKPWRTYRIRVEGKSIIWRFLRLR